MPTTGSTLNLENEPISVSADAARFEALRGLPVLLFGASGFIGRWVWKLLDQAGADVIATGRSEAKLDQLAGQWGLSGRRIAVDLTRPQDVADLHAGAGAALIINSAGYGVAPQESDPELNARINAWLPEQLAGLAGERRWGGQQLVHIGSAFEYGPVDGAVTEDTPANPGSPYAQMKLQGTERLTAAIGATGIRGLTARVCTVYGPGEHAHRLLPSLLRAGSERKPLELTPGEQDRDFTYVRDVAEGLLRIAMTDRAPAVVNLATGRSSTVREFSTIAYRTAGGDPRQLNFGALPYRSNEVWQGPVRVDRLRSLIDWAPQTGLADGIQQTYEIVRAEMGLK